MVLVLVLMLGVMLMFPHTRSGIFDAGRQLQSLYAQTMESARHSFWSLIEDSRKTDTGRAELPPGNGPVEDDSATGISAIVKPAGT